jgi:hypothetical protein
MRHSAQDIQVIESADITCLSDHDGEQNGGKIPLRLFGYRSHSRSSNPASAIELTS